MALRPRLPPGLHLSLLALHYYASRSGKSRYDGPLRVVSRPSLSSLRRPNAALQQYLSEAACKALEGRSMALTLSGTDHL